MSISLGIKLPNEKEIEFSHYLPMRTLTTTIIQGSAFCIRCISDTHSVSDVSGVTIAKVKYTSDTLCVSDDSETLRHLIHI